MRASYNVFILFFIFNNSEALLYISCKSTPLGAKIISNWWFYILTLERYLLYMIFFELGYPYKVLQVLQSRHWVQGC